MADFLTYIPWESNNENSSTASLFLARKFFYDKTLPYVIGDYIDEILPFRRSVEEKKFSPFIDLYKTNALYGYIDFDGDVIAPLENNNNFINVGNNFLLQNFAGQSFLDLKNFLASQTFIQNCITSESPFYNIIPTNGYMSNDNLYTSTYIIIGNDFRQFCLQNSKINQSIKNHKDFNKYLINYLKSRINLIPVTKSRMTLFYNFKKFSNGLTFKFSLSDPGNDVRKYIDFYLDPSFRSYYDACKRFGFSIDKNNPYILTADLNSTAMKKYMNRYGINGAKDLFTKRYKKVYFEDLQSLRDFFYSCYEIFLIDNDLYPEDIRNLCSKQANLSSRKSREKVTYYKYFTDFPDSYWIKLYIYFKNYELKIGFSQQEFENIYRVAKKMVDLGRLNDALTFVNSRFKETGDIHFFDPLQMGDSVVEDPTESVGKLSIPEIFL